MHCSQSIAVLCAFAVAACAGMSVIDVAEDWSLTVCLIQVYQHQRFYNASPLKFNRRLTPFVSRQVYPLPSIGTLYWLGLQENTPAHDITPKDLQSLASSVSEAAQNADAQLKALKGQPIDVVLGFQVTSDTDATKVLDEFINDAKESASVSASPPSS